jgi:alkylation response protein AidB-like acyl-CoA dehydrogenase
MLADSFMELHQLRLMVYNAAWKYDQGRDIRTEANMAKIFGDTQSFRAADRCMEIHGGMGLAVDLPIEKFWRDQRQHDDHRRSNRDSQNDPRPPCGAPIRVKLRLVC